MFSLLKTFILCAVCSSLLEHIQCVSESIVLKDTIGENLQRANNTTLEIRPGFSVPISHAHLYIYAFDDLVKKRLSPQEVAAYYNLVRQHRGVGMRENGREKHADLIIRLKTFSSHSE
jgi:hypothetical protein